MANLRTPLYDWHVTHQGRMVPFGGWEMPVQYTGIIDEHTAIRTQAGWFDISHMARVILEGEDALPLVQRLWTNDASKLKLGQIRYGLLCNEQAGILDDVLVYRFDGFWLMVVNAANRDKILAWIHAHAADLKVQITDRTRDWAMLAVQGPQAIARVEPLIGPASHLRYYHGEVRPPGRSSLPVQIVSRTGYTGEDGLEIILPADAALALADALVAAEIRPCGLGARDTLRLEAGMPLYGHELSEQIDPLQAGLRWAVKLAKSDFIGIEALRRLGEPVDRPVRIGLVLEGKRAAREGCPILAEDQPIGQVTSGSFAPTLQTSIAMAYVLPTYAAVNTALSVEIRGTVTPARVVPLPFYQRTNG